MFYYCRSVVWRVGDRNLVATIRADSLGWQIFSGILTVFMIAGLGALIATENNT